MMTPRQKEEEERQCVGLLETTVYPESSATVQAAGGHLAVHSRRQETHPLPLRVDTVRLVVGVAEPASSHARATRIYTTCPPRAGGILSLFRDIMSVFSTRKRWTRQTDDLKCLRQKTDRDMKTSIMRSSWIRTDPGRTRGRLIFYSFSFIGPRTDNDFRYFPGAREVIDCFHGSQSVELVII